MKNLIISFIFITTSVFASNDYVKIKSKWSATLSHYRINDPSNSFIFNYSGKNADLNVRFIEGDLATVSTVFDATINKKNNMTDELVSFVFMSPGSVSVTSGLELNTSNWNIWENGNLDIKSNLGNNTGNQNLQVSCWGGEKRSRGFIKIDKLVRNSKGDVKSLSALVTYECFAGPGAVKFVESLKISF